MLGKKKDKLYYISTNAAKPIRILVWQGSTARRLKLDRDKSIRRIIENLIREPCTDEMIEALTTTTVIGNHYILEWEYGDEK